MRNTQAVVNATDDAIGLYARTNCSVTIFITKLVNT